VFNFHQTFQQISQKLWFWVDSGEKRSSSHHIFFTSHTPIGDSHLKLDMKTTWRAHFW